MHDIRDPHASYRVAHIDELYHVTVYPKVPAAMSMSAYRFDTLPQWIQDACHMLDIAGVHYPVAGIGHKFIDNVYWIVPLDEDPKHHVQLSLFAETPP